MEPSVVSVNLLYVLKERLTDEEHIVLPEELSPFQADCPRPDRLAVTVREKSESLSLDAQTFLESMFKTKIDSSSETIL
jgi:hypothetical protein